MYKYLFKKIRNIPEERFNHFLENVEITEKLRDERIKDGEKISPFPDYFELEKALNECKYHSNEHKKETFECYCRCYCESCRPGGYSLDSVEMPNVEEYEQYWRKIDENFDTYDWPHPARKIVRNIYQIHGTIK